MPQKPIIFANVQESGHEALSGAMPSAMNVVVDGKGTVRRRPGITTYSELYSDTIDSNGIDAIHVANSGKTYVIGGDDPAAGGANRNIYRVTSGGAANLSGPGGATKLFGTARPTTAETEALLVIAGGSFIQKVEFATDASSRLGGDPPETTHVVANALRLLANDAGKGDDDDNTKVRYSGVSIGKTDFSGHEEWTFGGVGLSGFFTAEARPDPVQAIAENTNEIFVFGTTNVQVYTPDPQFAYATVAAREFGLAAPYSVIKVDQNFAWLDHFRRFVVSDGREFQVISDPIGSVLSSMTTVSDCFGYRIHEDPVDCYVWSFPTEGRTFAFQNNGGWSQWQGYDWSQNNWKNLPINCHDHDHNNDVNLVGTTNGKIGQMLMGQANDLTERINAFVETGFQDHGTLARKNCISVRLSFRRGTVTGSTAPVAFLQYADYPNRWSSPITIDLGVGGDTDPVVQFRSMGIYRERAWRFTFSGSTDLVLSSAIEEFEVLES